MRWLATDAGTALLCAAAQLPSDPLTRLTRLRRLCTPERASAAVELLELRRRAKVKFTRADQMFFTPEGLEQSTGEAIARYRAARFPFATPILDVCCGIGGDALALAARAPVLAVDADPAAACTLINTRQLAPIAPVRVVCADSTHLDLQRLRAAGIGAAFFDPSRRTGGRDGSRRRVRASEDYSPPLSWLETLCAHFPAVAVKVSPAIEDAELHRYGGAVEFLSDRGECKEAVLWLGELSATLPLGPGWHTPPNLACATVLRPGELPATLAPFTREPAPISTPQSWLYEPDPAVIRAHLVAVLAHFIEAAQLDPIIAYLTSDEAIETPFATGYRVLDWLPFQLKNVQARCRALGRNVVAIKRRGVPLEPEELRKRLTGTGQPGDPPVVIVLCRVGGKPAALLCEPSRTT